MRVISVCRTTTTAIVALLLIVAAAAGEEQAQNDETPATAAAEPRQPVSEPPIKLVHVLQPGEREYLSPNLLGVQNIAMSFLPLSMNFINVIDAYREIVNGVRYEMLVNAVDTNAKNEEIICRLVILEKPWLRTEWGDKYRELVNSNCTEASDAADAAKRGKALNDKYELNAIFNGGTRNELTVDEMARLEAQILPTTSVGGGSNSNKRRDTTTTTTAAAAAAAVEATTTTSTTTTSTTTTTTERATSVEHNEAKEAETVTPAININAAVGGGEGEAAGADEADNAAATTKIPELNDNEKQWLDDFLTVGAYNFEKTVEASKNQKQQQQQQQQNEATPIESHIADAAESIVSNYQQVEAGAAAPAGDNQKQLPLVETDARVEDDVAKESAQQQQQQQQQAQLNADVDVNRNADSAKAADPSDGDVDAQHLRAKRSSSSSNTLGGTNSISAKKAEELLQASLDKLPTGDGPTFRISEIFSATRQIVSGTLTKIDAELIDGNNEKQRCKVEIWSQSWLPNGNEVTFDCPNKAKVKVRHSRSVEYAEKKTHKKHNHHNLDKTEHLFHKFQIKFKRQYGTTMERQMRLRIFRQNLRTIEELNSNEMGSAKYGITEFADMTSTEYKQRTGLWQREEGKPTGGRPAVVPELDGDLPKEFDWREKNAVTHVKNQGNCGSCWAFSVTGNIEGLYAVKTGELREFSEQELLDCDTVDSACGGGLPDNAYKAIKDIGGLEYESEYPYKAEKNHCHFNTSLIHVQVKDFVDLPHNETAMQQWLISNGPISIGINANAMQFYRGGVSHPWKPLCSKKNLDHGVLIVGYGVSDYPNFHKTLPYWIVKNSWGPRWGEQGYYRVYRGDNTCGVSEMATSAVLV